MVHTEAKPPQPCPQWRAGHTADAACRVGIKHHAFGKLQGGGYAAGAIPRACASRRAFREGQGPGRTARRRPRRRGQQNRGRFAARGKPWMPMLRPGARGGRFCAHTPARTKRAKNFLPAPLTMCIYGVILCISYIYAFRSTLWTLSFKTQAASPFMSR